MKVECSQGKVSESFTNSLSAVAQNRQLQEVLLGPEGSSLAGCAQQLGPLLGLDAHGQYDREDEDDLNQLEGLVKPDHWNTLQMMDRRKICWGYVCQTKIR